MKLRHVRLMLALVLSAALVSAIGCATVASNGSADYPARSALIGKSRQQLLACAGTPVSERAGDEEVVAIYYKEASLLEESFPGSKSSYARVHHGCRATIVLKQDQVSEARYDSEPSSYQDEDLCEEIFALCVNQ